MELTDKETDALFWELGDEYEVLSGLIPFMTKHQYKETTYSQAPILTDVVSLCYAAVRMTGNPLRGIDL
ncbi:MAG: hypothetical protein ACKVQS_05940 [Fimbriimonadaceae bacterium]